jgi:hypothetical protein
MSCQDYTRNYENYVKISCNDAICPILREAIVASGALGLAADGDLVWAALLQPVFIDELDGFLAHR